MNDASQLTQEDREIMARIFGVKKWRQAATLRRDHKRDAGAMAVFDGARLAGLKPAEAISKFGA